MYYYKDFNTFKLILANGTYIDKITVLDDHYKIEFKSGISVDVEK
jgi:hypothetical protein